jgi:hypothetical protein
MFGQLYAVVAAVEMKIQIDRNLFWKVMIQKFIDG